MTEPKQDPTQLPPYIGEERRKDWHTPNNCPMAESTQKRFHDGVIRMNRIEAALKANKEEMKDNTAATKEVLEIVSMGKSFFKVAGAIGNGIKYLAGLVTVIAAAYAAWTNK